MATFITPVNFHYAALASEITGSLSQYSPVEFQYTFETFFHPFVGDLIAKLNQGSVADMLDPAFLSGLSRDYSAYYTFTEQSSDEFTFVDVNMPAAGVDVAVGGPYAVYNWELLYHIPVMIAVHLSQHQRFAEAEKWFHLVFDPTFTDSGSNPAYPFWKFLGFRQPGLAESLVDILSYSGGDPDQVKLRQQVLDGYTALLTTPFAPHVVARSRPLAYHVLRGDEVPGQPDRLGRQPVPAEHHRDDQRGPALLCAGGQPRSARGRSSFRLAGRPSR